MPKLTDKIIGESLEEFDEVFEKLSAFTEFNNGAYLDKTENIKSFLETKLRQMAEEAYKEGYSAGKDS